KKSCLRLAASPLPCLDPTSAPIASYRARLRRLRVCLLARPVSPVLSSLESPRELADWTRFSPFSAFNFKVEISHNTIISPFLYPTCPSRGIQTAGSHYLHIEANYRSWRRRFPYHITPDGAQSFPGLRSSHRRESRLSGWQSPRKESDRWPSEPPFPSLSGTARRLF
ncbi:hypothetical protein BC827DRAFT_1377245, partial [Russula dissimulans]